jgi:hypothetical protein
MLALIGSVGAILLSFSRFAWATPAMTMAGAVGAFFLAVILIGQAKAIELLAVVSARVKSRFALEHLTIPAAAPAASAEPKLPLVTATPKERVITIPEEVARQQGLTRR